jgi:hypothetical protein
MLILAVTFITTGAMADVKISGKVVDNKEKPVKGANVYLDNSIDGATTDSLGQFSFTTSEKGPQSLVATEISHETMGMPLVINGDTSGIVLRMMVSKTHDLDVVTITAGSFDANDRNKTVLKPLDIVTTAGSGADVVKAMQYLPGTQQAGTENGLFVRGGDASEAAVIIDGMTVQNAFFSGAPGVATRSRFGPFSFQGVSFSSGGYSARYGQALSGVLELNSVDIADKSTINLGASFAGVYGSGTKKWKKSSLDVGGSYNNLTPFYKLAATNFKFYDVPVGGSGNARYVWTPNKHGILKASANFTFNKIGVGVPNPFAAGNDTGNIFYGMPDTINFQTRDNNFYSNISYKQMFKNKYTLFTAASVSMNKTDNSFGGLPMNQEDFRDQFRIEGKDFVNARMNLLVGAELQAFGIRKTFGSFVQEFTETQTAAYAELEWTPIYWLAVKPGVRYENSILLGTNKIAPRIAFALRTTSHSQASLAGGMFYQNPDNMYLLAGKRPDMQLATHYIANWQWSRNDRTLRLEGYYKDYSQLVREMYSSVFFDPNRYRMITGATTVNNSGNGYAQGFELFWRDKKTFKNTDYWISYSYIDTRRLYQNFPYKATPGFIANHNLSLVGKYFVTKWNTNFSATYSYSSGYPYYNVNTPLTAASFLKDHTKAFNNVALTVAYLHSFGKWFTVFYVSIDNVLNTHNIYGYRYGTDAATGQITQSPIVPALYRTVFAGVNMSLTQFSKDEL